MITQLQQLFATVSTQVKPEDLFLQKDSLVYFTTAWPDTWKWCSGKLFRVKDEPIIVPYSASYILPSGDYKDIDLSNSAAGAQGKVCLPPCRGFDVSRPHQCYPEVPRGEEAIR